MKLRNILIAGLSVWALSGCSDYLDVDAPSKLDPEYVYSDTKEINRALNGVYNSLMGGDLYGGGIFTNFAFNTDVETKLSSNEYATSSSYQRYDCDPDGGQIKKFWDALYQGIERANMLIDGINASFENGTFDKDDADVNQMLGEAMVLRAIFYHELTSYFGDVPYSMAASYNQDKTLFDVVDRTKILDDQIKCLEEIAPKMKMGNSTGFTEGPERISKEACWAMIARLAMSAGGYSLRPDGSNIGKMQRPDNYLDYYKTAAKYCDLVITESGHTLNLPYHQVFVNECNFVVTPGDDVIFEIPFGKESTGNIGYIHGPKMDNASGTTPHAWGRATSSAQLDAHYRFMFDADDVRRDYVNQLFSYTSVGVATLNNGRTNYNGKWSKLWNATGLGATTEGNTGINYPYLRYADVLLTSAEAENELNGAPNGKAIERYEMVRQRAFKNAPEKVATPNAYGSKEDFLRAVLDERKFEFAGENMRWRDLVRNNMLSEVVYMSFLRYYNSGDRFGDLNDYISEYDFADGRTWDRVVPGRILYYNDVPNSPDRHGYLSTDKFPQTSPNMNICAIINPYHSATTEDNAIRDINSEGKAAAPAAADYFNWYDDDLSSPRQEILYMMRGYIYWDYHYRIFRMKGANGEYAPVSQPNALSDYSTLPPVRYILPYPRAVITRAQGKYENKYGYR